MISVLLLESKLFPGPVLQLSHWESSVLPLSPDECVTASLALTPTMARLVSDPAA